jgi:hypothetical protein
VPARADSRPDGHLELEGLPRHHLAAEAGLVDPPEQRELARIPLVGEHCDATELCQRLHHEHPRQRRPTREVAGEERLVAGEVPAPHRLTAGHDRDHLTHEEKRLAMGKDVARFHAPGRLAARCQPAALDPADRPPRNTGANSGSASSAIRRGGSRATSENSRCWPRVNTSRAARGGGAPRPASGA